MTILKKTGAALGMIAAAFTLHAQNVTMKTGGETKFKIQKGGEAAGYMAGGNSYFITSAFEQATMKYYLEGFDASGTALAQRHLEVNPGVFNNSYGIDDVVSFGGKMYVLVEHLDKPAGKNTLTARVMGNGGAIMDGDTPLMSMPFEKTMNSGYNFAAVSEDQGTMAIVGLLPYEKEMAAKLRIAVYGKDFQKKHESEVTIPGEDTKNKSLRIAAGNDGTVYIIRQTSMKNGEMVLDIYQYTGSAELKPYHFEMAAPNYFTTYAYTVNTAGELVISGTYYERKTVSTGDRKASGIFYFTNKGKSEQVFSTFPLDAPAENLTARKVLVNGNTIFLAAEQYKEEKITPPAGTGATSFDYSYNYTHRNEYMIAMDTEGNKKFELILQKDFTARDFDKQYYSAYYIVNGKLTVLYNDRAAKYMQGTSYTLVPVLTQITNDGLMQSPVVFTDKLKLPEYYDVFFPAFSVQRSANEVAVLMRHGDLSQYVTLKID